MKILQKLYSENYKKYNNKKTSALRGIIMFYTSSIISFIYLGILYCLAKLKKKRTFWRVLHHYLYWFTYKYWQWVGVHYRIIGNVPKGGVIVASKHESAWETMSLNHILYKPCYIFKIEMHKIPFVGKVLNNMNMICVNRGKGPSSLKGLLRQAKKRAQEKRTIIIFSEGKRIVHGKIAPLKSGTYAVYKYLGIDVIPMALNSGLIWPKGKYPRAGIITVKFFPPIKPGLNQVDFDKAVIKGINALQ